jgi:chromosome segregation ATPase
LNDEIENKRREISQLSSERDILRSKINDHCQKLSEIEKKDVEDGGVDGDHAEDNKNEEDGNIGEGQTETESTSDTSKKERLIVMKSEVDELEQACLDCTNKISQLETSCDRLTAKLNDKPSPAQSVRKMHRYEFLWEHKLPYPIQSIGSSVCERSGNLECFITTKHTVHVFRVLSMRMVDAAAVLLERKFQQLP